LASGIQTAGPNLNAQTFAQGLQRAQFPNPDTGIKAGHVGFNAGNHSMTIDAAEWYWSATNPGPYPDEQSGGTYCYVDHGARHSLTNPFPPGDPLFNGACDTGAEPAGNG